MSVTTRPTVSVVMPVRDGAEYLEQAVRSILDQSWRDLELIALDDGSRDGTPAILARLSAVDTRMRILAVPSHGPAQERALEPDYAPGCEPTPGRLVAALNAGLATARGRLVARMDADDVALPERLARQVAALDAAPGVALVGTGWRVIEPDGTVRRTVQPPADAGAIRAALSRSNPIAHPSVMFRRNAVLALGGYRPAFLLAEDFDLWLRLSERHDLINLAEPLLDYREHAGQVSWRSVEQRALSEMAALAAAARRRAGHPDGADVAAPADRALLRRLGMDEAAVEAGLLGRAIGSAKHALAAGRHEAARGFLRVALAQPGLRSRTRLHLWLLRLRAAFG